MSLIHNKLSKSPIRTVFCLLLLAALATLSWGQLPGLGQRTPPAKGTEQTEPIDKIIEGLQKALINARQNLASFQASLGSTSPGQIGATSGEILEKQHLLNLRVFVLDQHLQAYRKLQEIQQSRADLEQKAQAWIGFSEPPPYSLALVDDLRDQIQVQEFAIRKNEVLRAMALQEHQDALEKLKASEQNLRRATEALERPATGEEKLRLVWLNDLAALEKQVAGEKTLATNTQIQGIEESLSYYQAKIDFLDRQLKVAVASSSFTREEFDRKLAAIAQKQEELASEQKRNLVEENQKEEQLREAREKLQQAREAMAKAPREDKRLKTAIQQLQNLVDLRKAQSETIGQKVELQKLWGYGLASERLIWENRYRLANLPREHDETELGQAAKTIAERLEKLREYRSFAETNLKLAQNQVLNEEKRLSEGSLTENERTFSRQKLAAYVARADNLAKILVQIDSLELLAGRYQDEVAERRKKSSLTERLGSALDNALKWAGRIWNYEIFSVEDTIMVNGQPVTTQRPVTISKVVKALLILIIGLWVTRLLKHRLSGLAARIFDIDPGAGELVEKFFQFLVVLCLLIVALVTAKIPLTVFAFLGGALAIGVGFGAQNLINNFISGVILLFERPIKTGDLVEMEGTRGRVVSIGLRCSQVRRFDGVDILVPNSEFLQKNVVNWTLTDQLLRLQVKVGVAYGSPTRDVSRILAKTLEEHGKVLRDPEPVILFEDFGDSALLFSAFFWVEISQNLDYRIIASDFRHMLDKRFRDAGITIAFPQIDVHLDSTRPVEAQVPEIRKKTSADKTPPEKEEGEGFQLMGSIPEGHAEQDP